MTRGPGPTSSPLSAQTRHRLELELSELRSGYHTLTAAIFDTDAVKDTGDQAQRIERADDLARLSDRIHQITEVLAGRVPPAPTDALPEGTEVTILFSDDSIDTMQVTTVRRHGGTVTRNSPLGRALTSAHPGDRVPPHPTDRRSRRIAVRPPDG